MRKNFARKNHLKLTANTVGQNGKLEHSSNSSSAFVTLFKLKLIMSDIKYVIIDILYCFNAFRGKF
jgi:hypothetical protein